MIVHPRRKLPLDRQLLSDATLRRLFSSSFIIVVMLTCSLGCGRFSFASGPGLADGPVQDSGGSGPDASGPGLADGPVPDSSGSGPDALVSGDYSTTDGPALGTALPPRMPESSGSGLLIVDPINGQDPPTGDGSAAKPFRTINQAIAVVNLTGGVIQVKGNGVSIAATPSEPAIYWARAGSPTNPVTIRTETPLGVTITGPSSGGSFTLGVLAELGGTGLRVRGFKVSVLGLDSYGIQLDRGTNNIEIDGCEITGNGGRGLYWKGGRVGTAEETHDLQLWNSVLHDNGADCEIADNFCTINSPNASVGGASGGTAYHAGIVTGVIANNVFYGSVPGAHLVVGPQAHSFYVVNNTFVGNAGHAGKSQPDYPSAGDAVGFYAEGNESYATSDIVIKNNIMATNRGHAVYGGVDFAISGNLVEHNLAWQNQNLSGDSTSNDFQTTDDGLVIFAVGPGGNVSGIDPQFSDTSFHLRSTGPALGAGDPAYTPPLDREGRRRVAADLGAYGRP